MALIERVVSELCLDARLRPYQPVNQSRYNTHRMPSVLVKVSTNSRPYRRPAWRSAPLRRAINTRENAVSAMSSPTLTDSPCAPVCYLCRRGRSRNLRRSPLGHTGDFLCNQFKSLRVKARTNSGSMNLLSCRFRGLKSFELICVNK